jgi:hypothetical protein
VKFDPLESRKEKAMSIKMKEETIRKLGILSIWLLAAYFMFTEGSVVLVFLAIIFTARNRRNTHAFRG